MEGCKGKVHYQVQRFAIYPVGYTEGKGLTSTPFEMVRGFSFHFLLASLKQSYVMGTVVKDI